MFSVFKKFWPFKRVAFDSAARDPARYEEEKKIARADDAARRLTLARDTETHQEILYYLASHDPDPQVRLAVAQNKAMPVQASPVLAGDRNEDVRLALAERLLVLLPDLSRDKHSQLYAFAAQALGTLALDEVLKIRKALSSTLKDYAHAPPKVVGQLARDVEREVSEPILRFCAALSDQDLLEILKKHPAPWAVQAIAARERVSDPVSRAVIHTEDPPAGKILLENEGAVITRGLLETIVERARHYPEWQKPAAIHKNLSPAMATQLAEFADDAVRDVLMRRDDFDKESVEGIAAIFRRRLSYADKMYQEEKKEDPLRRVMALEKEGRLTEEALSDAVALQDRAFIYAALARLAKTDIAMVEKIFAMQAPKPIIALGWRAGLSMRFVLQLQKELGRVPPRSLIYPRGGTDYPLSEDEIRWQLEFLGF